MAARGARVLPATAPSAESWLGRVTCVFPESKQMGRTCPKLNAAGAGRRKRGDVLMGTRWCPKRTLPWDPPRLSGVETRPPSQGLLSCDLLPLPAPSEHGARPLPGRDRGSERPPSPGSGRERSYASPGAGDVPVRRAALMVVEKCTPHPN